MFVDLNNAPQHASIIVKVGVPIGITEHHVRSAVRTMLIGRVEETPQIWMNAQSVEVIAGRLKAPGRNRIVAGVQRNLRDAEGNQIVKTAISLAQVQIIGVRMIGGIVS